MNNEKALRAAGTLIKYCKRQRRDCAGCIFNTEIGCYVNRPREFAEIKPTCKYANKTRCLQQFIKNNSCWNCNYCFKLSKDQKENF